MVKLIRDHLDSCGFLEIETPMLTRSTPEGARDYLVPSRTSPGSFYALPQSPQLFKQLLMAGGVERYFQIARCFRDEDLRADRQPEFTQIDIEASFLGRERLFAIVEGMMTCLYGDLLGRELSLPFPRLPYSEAIARFGSDKPDLRFGMELVDCSEPARESEFKIFRAALEAGGAVKALRVPGKGGASRKELDDLVALAVEFGARGLAWLIRDAEGWRLSLIHISLRALDCKEERCRELVRQAPQMTDRLCPGCEAHFRQLREILDRLQVPYLLNPRLVRGLDYYSRTAFEFVPHSANAQGSLGGGGRYDYLVEYCGGPRVPGVGVAFGVERLLAAAPSAAAPLFTAGKPPLYIAAAGEGLAAEALSLAEELRRQGVAAEAELMERSLKGQMKYAGRKGFQTVLIIGSRELAEGTVTLRHMATGEQEEPSRKELLQRLLPGDPCSGEAGLTPPGGTSSGFAPEEEPPGCGELRAADAGREVALHG